MIYFNTKSKRQVLYDQVFSKKDAEKFIIITGYIGPQMINELEELDYYDEIILVVGMYGKKINYNLHKSILNSNSNIPNLKIYYTNSLVHTKLYSWFKNDTLQEFLIGSANFSTSALIENPYKETLYNSKVEKESEEILDYIKYIFSNMYPCTDLKTDQQISQIQYTPGMVADEIETYKVVYSQDVCKLSLRSTSTGKGVNILGIKNEKDDVHAAAGLNWGYTAGLPLLGDAYIPITRSNIQQAPNLLPVKPEGENKPIEVIWDDGTTMLLLLEGNGALASEGNYYPKQISTYKNKSELGTYIRKRIGDKIGKNLVHSQESIMKLKKLKKEYSGNKDGIIEAIKKDSELEKELRDKFITNKHLEEYGRYDITVKLLTEGIYSFDFSV